MKIDSDWWVSLLSDETLFGPETHEHEHHPGNLEWGSLEVIQLIYLFLMPSVPLLIVTTYQWPTLQTILELAKTSRENYSYFTSVASLGCKFHPEIKSIDTKEKWQTKLTILFKIM